MDLENFSIQIKDNEYRSLVKLIYEKCGINLGDQKQELMKTRLGKRLRGLGLKSYGDYFKYATTPENEAELDHLINAISTNFTSFFRENKHFEFLSKVALDNIVKRKEASGSKKIRAWCAAASSGEEPYSIGITLSEYFQHKPSWDIKLLATDISSKVLTEAYKGTYSFEKVKMIELPLLDRYFTYQEDLKGRIYHVTDELKRMIVYRRLNLMDEIFPFHGPFDFIFCRNVMIYFDQATQATLINKLLRYLTPGGYFFTSHSENLPVVFRGKVEVIAPAIYRKMSS